MQYSKKIKSCVGAVVLITLLYMVMPVNTMKRLREAEPALPLFIQDTKNSDRNNEIVWVQTFDGTLLEVPRWQIDQSKVLQVLFVHQKGTNSKDNPIDVSQSMIPGKQLQLLQTALQKASNLKQFKEDFYALPQSQQKSLCADALTLEMQGLAALLMNYIFPDDIQQQIGATVLEQAGIIAPVIAYLQKPEILKGHTDAVTCVACSPNDNYIVSGSMDKNVIVWNIKTGKQIKMLKGHRGMVWCVACSPDDNYIVSGSVDKDLILWNGKTGEQIKKLKGHTDAIWCVAYSPDGNYIVSGSGDKNLILWNGKTGEQIKILEGHRSVVGCVAYSPDGNYIVSGSNDKNLILWNGKTGEQIKMLEGHSSVVGCVAYSPDGNYIVSGSWDNNLIVWDGKTGEQIKVLKGHGDEITCVAYSPDGNYIVSGSEDNSLILWNGKTGDQIKILQEHSDAINNAVTCVAYSPDGNYIISADKCLKLWNGKTGDAIKIFQGNDIAVRCLAYSLDGNYIVSGSADNNVMVWKCIDNQILNSIAHNLNIAQARLLYRLYVAKINNVPVILDSKDLDYQIYLSLPTDVQKVVDVFLPFKISGKFAEIDLEE